MDGMKARLYGMPQLEVVPISAPEPPYPADVRANGWHFQLDTTRMTASDTWTLARPELRPWLLMLWLVSWQETPCGTLPADDDLIVAKLGIDPGLFTGHRGLLMRGWRRHSDGRMYHSVLTEHVLDMCNSRRKDAERVRKWRENQDKQRNALPTRKLHVSNTTGSGSGSGSGSGEKPFNPTTARLPALVEDSKHEGEKRTSKPATLLRDDWTLPDEWRDWAVRVHHLDPQKVVRMSLSFRDYWTSLPAAKAARRNWFRTWTYFVRMKVGDA